jgi:hypothetical protein
MTTRPMLTQREAATACGVSRTTIRRRREAGDLPNSVQDPQRGWLIPVDDLLAAGFRLNAPAPPDQEQRPVTAAGDVGQDQEHAQEPVDVAALRAELERIRHTHELELANERHGRELAEAREEHLRSQLAARGEHIADLQRALAALMPAPERTELLASTKPVVPGQGHHPAPVTEDSEPAGEESPRRRWWGGRR